MVETSIVMLALLLMVTKGCMETMGFGQRNVEGEMLLELASALDLVVVNTCFKKRDSQKVTFESGGARTVVDYVLVRRQERAALRDAKVIPGEPELLQHRLVVCVLEVQECVKPKKQQFLAGVKCGD